MPFHKHQAGFNFKAIVERTAGTFWTLDILQPDCRCDSGCHKHLSQLFNPVDTAPPDALHS